MNYITRRPRRGNQHLVCLLGSFPITPQHHAREEQVVAMLRTEPAARKEKGMQSHAGVAALPPAAVAAAMHNRVHSTRRIGHIALAAEPATGTANLAKPRLEHRRVRSRRDIN